MLGSLTELGNMNSQTENGEEPEGEEGEGRTKTRKMIKINLIFSNICDNKKILIR